MRRPINVDVLIIDDFQTIGINQRVHEDLAMTTLDRDGHLPKISAFQSTAAYWVEELPNRIKADSLVSQLNTGHASASATTTCTQVLTPPTSDDLKPVGDITDVRARKGFGEPCS